MKFKSPRPLPYRQKQGGKYEKKDLYLRFPGRFMPVCSPFLFKALRRLFEEIDIMYVTNTDVSYYSDIKDPSRLSAFCAYFSRFSFVPKKAHVFSSHTISLSAPGKDTRFYLWLGNDGRLLEIQWYGPGGNDGSAVFESNGEMSVSELLSAMGF